MKKVYFNKGYGASVHMGLNAFVFLIVEKIPVDRLGSVGIIRLIINAVYPNVVFGRKIDFSNNNHPFSFVKAC